MDELPEEVRRLIGVPCHHQVASVAVERGAVRLVCGAVRNANPIFWDTDAARRITGGEIAPPSALSTWLRPDPWAPGQTEEPVPLRLHFEIKALLGLPMATITENVLVLYEPVRVGDVLTAHQVLRSVSEPKTTRLGTGRFWTIDVEVTNQVGERCGTDTYTGFGYRRTA